MALVFYDTETTGLDTSFDQILQFAAIRTDADLNEVDRFEIRCRISPYVVPSPDAMLVTGITIQQLTNPSLPSYYEMIGRVREKVLEWTPATFVGYNSLRFDEHLLRQALYMNLFPPYLTNTNRNCRSDVMRAVQAAALYVPNALVVPMRTDGRASFRLKQVASANGYAYESPHDALDDVKATIHLARLLDERAPDIWSAFMRFSNKAAAIDYLSEETVVTLSDFYFGQLCSWHVTWLGENTVNRAEQYVFNLEIDPDDLKGLSDTDLVRRLAIQPEPVRSVRVNAAPILMPADEAPRSTSTWSIGMEELECRAQRLHEDVALRQRLIVNFEATRPEQEPSIHVEQQIYNGFFNPSDHKRMEAFHRSSWKKRLQIVSTFEDPRLRELGMRLIHVERPDILEVTSRNQRTVAILERLISNDETVPWLTLPKAIKQVNDLIASAENLERRVLRRYRDYFSKRLDAAIACLT